MRFLGLDLAWKNGNPSGAVLLSGGRLPLRVDETLSDVRCHADALAWIARQVRGHRSAVGIDAPLLGLGRGGRRPCDDLVSSTFGRFQAATWSPSQVPALRRFTRALLHAYGHAAFTPDARPRRGHPVVREVYPNALQVLLFDLERPGGTIVPYKRRRFASRRDWVTRGLRPFVARCIKVLGGRYVLPVGAPWRALVAERPRISMGTTRLKAIEDRWDGLLCALAVALEHHRPDAMRLYPDRQWARGAILAPALGAPGRRPARGRGRPVVRASRRSEGLAPHRGHPRGDPRVSSRPEPRAGRLLGRKRGAPRPR